jgi:hypothetical protein
VQTAENILKSADKNSSKAAAQKLLQTSFNVWSKMKNQGTLSAFDAGQPDKISNLLAGL